MRGKCKMLGCEIISTRENWFKNILKGDDREVPFQNVGGNVCTFWFIIFFCVDQVTFSAEWQRPPACPVWQAWQFGQINSRWKHRGVVFSPRRVCSQRENGRGKFALWGGKKKPFRLIIHVRGGGGVGVKKKKKKKKKHIQCVKRPFELLAGGHKSLVFIICLHPSP